MWTPCSEDFAPRGETTPAAAAVRSAGPAGYGTLTTITAVTSDDRNET